VQQTGVESNTNLTVTDAEVDKYFDSKGEDVPEAMLEEAEPSSIEPGTQVEPVQPIQQAEPETDIKQVKAAMHEERERRKEYQRRLEEQGHELYQVKSQYQQIMERIQQAQAPQPPSFDEDPLGAMAHQLEKQRQAIEYQQAVETHRMQEQQQMQRMQAFQDTYKNTAIQYANQQKDFGDAYKYLIDHRFNELKKYGWDDQTAQRLMLEDEMAIVSNAFQSGLNPAQQLYEAAKFRGYPGKAPQGTAQDKIRDHAKAKESAVSLSNTPSSSRSSEGLTAEAILAMDDAEFDKLTPAQWKKAFGG